MLGVLGGTALAPTIYNDKLYSDNGPNINCLNPLTGEVIWKFTVSYSGFRPPVGMNGKIYANTKGGELYAINADNGTLAWKYGSHENSNPSLGNVTAANEMVYFGNWNNTITALNATTGATQWVFFGTRPFYGGILIVDNAGNQFHSSFSGNKQ
jgi:outer membrane protein assembly factor BamB